MDKVLDGFLAMFLMAGTFALGAVGYMALVASVMVLNDGGCKCGRGCPPPVPVESIPIDRTMQPMIAPFDDTITFSPGNLLRKEF